MKEEHSINCYCNECVGIDYSDTDFNEVAEQLNQERQQAMAEQIEAM